MKRVVPTLLRGAEVAVVTMLLRGAEVVAAGRVCVLSPRILFTSAGMRPPEVVQ